MRLMNIASLATVVAIAVASPALAGKAGGGHGGGGGGNTTQSASCSVNPSSVAVGANYVVSASGLPIDSAINLWVTGPSGSSIGSALGSTADGTANLSESASSAGTWTYTFSGPTKNNMATMPVYATCSVDAY